MRARCEEESSLSRGEAEIETMPIARMCTVLVVGSYLSLSLSLFFRPKSKSRLSGEGGWAVYERREMAQVVAKE